MLIKAIFPWILIFIFSYVLSGFIYHKFKISKRGSTLVAFTLGPVFSGQLLYILYLFAPKAVNEFYVLVCVSIFAILTFSLWPYRFKGGLNIAVIINRLKKLDVTTYFYLVVVTLITVFIFVRMIIWPLVWSDQVDYYYQTHGYVTEKTSEYYTLNPLVKKKVVGIRPGLPLITNFFVLFEKDNIVVEKQLQLIIFYYYLVTLVSLYLIAKQKRNSIKAGLFSVFLLLTCFYFTKFIIYGLKEIIIVSLGMILVYIFSHISDVKNNLNSSKWVIVAFIFGAMSFIHFTGTVVAFILGISLLITSSGKLSKKLCVACLIGVLVLLTSLGETIYFSRWVTKELTPPSLMVLINSDTFFSISRLEMDLLDGMLNSYNINTTKDIILKGKLQGFTQFHYFGFVYWFSFLLLIFGLKKIIKDKQSKFVALFVVGFLLLIFNPLSFINHAAVRVLVSSPKYYLLMLPFFIILAMHGYSKYQKLIDRISNNIFLTIIAILLALSWVANKLTLHIYESLSAALVTSHRLEVYYVDKLGDLISLLFWGSLLTLMVIGLFKLTKRIIEKEVIISAYVFLLPFTFFLNSNFNFSNTIKYSLSGRTEKIAYVSEKYPGLLQHISYVVGKHNDGELILIYGFNKELMTNYYILIRDDIYFKYEVLPKYAFDNYRFEPKERDYSWAIVDNTTEVPKKYVENMDVVSKNGQATLYKRYD